VASFTALKILRMDGEKKVQDLILCIFVHGYLDELLDPYASNGADESF
jgi:hypothetical protein